MAFEIKKGNLLPALSATLSDQSGVLDLSGCSVEFAFRLLDGTTVTTRAATIVSPAAGTVRYEWTSGDTDIVGVYYCEFIVTYANGKKITCPSNGFLTFQVTEKL